MADEDKNKKDKILDFLLIALCLWRKNAPEKLDEMLKELKNKE